MSLSNLIRKLGLISSELQTEPLDAKTTATANTAGESVTFTLPMDMLLFGIDLKCAKSTDGALTDNITNIELKLDGNKVLKDYTGKNCKATNLLAHFKPSTGFYKVIIADPDLKTDPLNLEKFTTGTLKVTTGDGGSGVKNTITPTLALGNRAAYPSVKDLGLGRVLVEKNLPLVSYLAATGNLIYLNERVNKVFGYLLETGDSLTLADTTFATIKMEGRNPNRTVTPINAISLAQLKELNTQDTNGNPLPTGEFYLPFSDGLATSDFASLRTILNATVAGTDKQAQMCERYILGGV